MVSFYFLSHRFKRSMLEITSDTSYDVLWKYLLPHKKQPLPRDVIFSVAAGKKKYDIIRLYESGEYFYSKKIIDIFSQFVDMSDKCYPINIKDVDQPYYVIYNLERFQFFNQDENLFDDEPACIGAQDTLKPLFSLEHTKAIIVSENIKDALLKEKVSNIELEECFGCSFEEFQKLRESGVQPEVHVYNDR